MDNDEISYALEGMTENRTRNTQILSEYRCTELTKIRKTLSYTHLLPAVKTALLYVSP